MQLVVELDLPRADRRRPTRGRVRVVEPRFLAVSCCCFALLLVIVGALVVLEAW